MSIKSALFSYLSTNVGVVAVAGDRVYPQVIPKQVYDTASKRPCVVYAVQDTDRSRTFCATETLRLSRVSLDCYDRTYEGAETLAETVRQALTDYTGAMGSVQVEQADLENDYDVDPTIDPGLFRVRLVYAIWHH